MKTPFLRLVAAVLIPCLLVDPAFTAALSQGWPAHRQGTQSSLFLKEALSTPSLALPYLKRFLAGGRQIQTTLGALVRRYRPHFRWEPVPTLQNESGVWVSGGHRLQIFFSHAQNLFSADSHSQHPEELLNRANRVFSAFHPSLWGRNTSVDAFVSLNRIVMGDRDKKSQIQEKRSKRDHPGRHLPDNEVILTLVIDPAKLDSAESLVKEVDQIMSEWSRLHEQQWEEWGTLRHGWTPDDTLEFAKLLNYPVPFWDVLTRLINQSQGLYWGRYWGSNSPEHLMLMELEPEAQRLLDFPIAHFDLPYDHIGRNVSQLRNALTTDPAARAKLIIQSGNIILKDSYHIRRGEKIKVSSHQIVAKGTALTHPMVREDVWPLLITGILGSSVFWIWQFGDWTGALFNLKGWGLTAGVLLSAATLGKWIRGEKIAFKEWSYWKDLVAVNLVAWWAEAPFLTWIAIKPIWDADGAQAQLDHYIDAHYPPGTSRESVKQSWDIRKKAAQRIVAMSVFAVVTMLVLIGGVFLLGGYQDQDLKLLSFFVTSIFLAPHFVGHELLHNLWSRYPLTTEKPGSVKTFGDIKAELSGMPLYRFLSLVKAGYGMTGAALLILGIRIVGLRQRIGPFWKRNKQALPDILLPTGILERERAAMAEKPPPLTPQEELRLAVADTLRLVRPFVKQYRSAIEAILSPEGLMIYTVYDDPAIIHGNRSSIYVDDNNTSHQNDRARPTVEHILTADHYRRHFHGERVQRQLVWRHREAAQEFDRLVMPLMEDIRQLVQQRNLTFVEEPQVPTEGLLYSRHGRQVYLYVGQFSGKSLYIGLVRPFSNRYYGEEFLTWEDVLKETRGEVSPVPLKEIESSQPLTEEITTVAPLTARSTRERTWPLFILGTAAAFGISMGLFEWTFTTSLILWSLYSIPLPFIAWRVKRNRGEKTTLTDLVAENLVAWWAEAPRLIKIGLLERWNPARANANADEYMKDHLPRDAPDVIKAISQFERYPIARAFARSSYQTLSMGLIFMAFFGGGFLALFLDGQAVSWEGFFTASLVSLFGPTALHQFILHELQRNLWSRYPLTTGSPSNSMEDIWRKLGFSKKVTKAWVKANLPKPDGAEKAAHLKEPFLARYYEGKELVLVFIEDVDEAHMRKAPSGGWFYEVFLVLPDEKIDAVYFEQSRPSRPNPVDIVTRLGAPPRRIEKVKDRTVLIKQEGEVHVGSGGFRFALEQFLPGDVIEVRHVRGQAFLEDDFPPYRKALEESNFVRVPGESNYRFIRLPPFALTGGAGPGKRKPQRGSRSRMLQRADVAGGLTWNGERIPRRYITESVGEEIPLPSQDSLRKMIERLDYLVALRFPSLDGLVWDLGKHEWHMNGNHSYWMELGFSREEAIRVSSLYTKFRNAVLADQIRPLNYYPFTSNFHQLLSDIAAHIRLLLENSKTAGLATLLLAVLFNAGWVGPESSRVSSIALGAAFVAAGALLRHASQIYPNWRRRPTSTPPPKRPAGTGARALAFAA
jgi:hypothetical protein